MRAVLDTNVIVSGLLWRGTPRALVEQARVGTLGVITSPALIAELSRVVRRPKFRTILTRSNTDPDRILTDLRLLADIIDPPPLPAPVSRDPDDDAVLALAVAAHADFVVSGDSDLLVLGSYEGIPIVAAPQALSLLAIGYR